VFPTYSTEGRGAVKSLKQSLTDLGRRKKKEREE